MLLTKVQIVDKKTLRHYIKMEIANIATNEALLIKWHLEIEVEKEQDNVIILIWICAYVYI